MIYENQYGYKSNFNQPVKIPVENSTERFDHPTSTTYNADSTSIDPNLHTIVLEGHHEPTNSLNMQAKKLESSGKTT
jgi:hypothetical protein